MLQNHIDA